MATVSRGLPASCPYSWEEIRQYLENEHYKWVLEESPTTFAVKGVVAERRDGDVCANSGNLALYQGD